MLCFKAQCVLLCCQFISLPVASQYHLVDLAGSERVKKVKNRSLVFRSPIFLESQSKATGQRLEEAKHINSSLSALERCILLLSQRFATSAE